MSLSVNQVEKYAGPPIRGKHTWTAAKIPSPQFYNS